MADVLRKDVIVIGAGASGMLCAGEAARRGRSVLLLDHGGQVGRKVAVSGGGRCNVTNASVTHDRYISENPQFCRSALSRFQPRDIVGLLERNRLHAREEDDGKLFCTEGGRAVVAALRRECENAGAEFVTGCRISIVEKDRLFRVRTDRGEFRSEALVVATGGLSYRKLGASDLGYRIARSFGIGVTDLRPGLVPFVLPKAGYGEFSALSGVSLPVEARCGSARFSGSMLFTHRGVSGPVVLQLSNYWNGCDPVRVNLLPGRDASAFLFGNRHRKVELRTLLSSLFPKRFADAWCMRNGDAGPLNQYGDRDLRRIAEGMEDWSFLPSGTEGYDRAEVTLGGVDTDALSSKTMEAKQVQGLYFIGEVVDVTGQLGGYNLHWAWASGHAAGQHV